MRTLLTLPALLLTGMLVMAACPPTTAQAQEFNEIQAVIKPQINLERMRYHRRLIQGIGEQRLKSLRWRRVSTPSETESGQDATFGLSKPSGVLGDSEKHSGSIYPLSAETDDLASSALTGSLWMDGGKGMLEDSAPLRPYEGSQSMLSGGFDLQLTDALLLGAILSNSRSDIDNVFLPGNSTTDTQSFGLYGAVFLDDTTVLTFSALHNETRNEADSFGVTADYDSVGWTATSTLTKYFIVDAWQFAPSMGVSFDHDRDDAYTDSAATRFASETTRTGVATLGFSVSHTTLLDTGLTLTPTVSAEVEHEFYRSVSADTSVAANDENTDATVTAGLEIGLSDALSISVEGSMSGLLKQDYQSHLFTGRLTLSF